MRAAFVGFADLAGAFFGGAAFFMEDFRGATLFPDGWETDFLATFLAAPFAAADLPPAALPATVPAALPRDFAAADLPADFLPADLPADDFAPAEL